MNDGTIPPGGHAPPPGATAAAADTRWEPQDKVIFANVMAHMREQARAGLPPGALVLAASRFFLGAPYAEGSLEGVPERLVVNLRSFDCFTLVENAAVLAHLARREGSAFPEYIAALRAVRYRSGIVDGYPSRLHYFTDWIFENARRGFVQDMTRTLGGRFFRKRIAYMTAHAAHYPALQDPEVRRRLRAVERRLSRRVRREITREALPAAERGIADGDIVAILTDRDGLDCLHVGLAARVGGRLRLLHASSRAGAVIVSPETLSAYLADRPDCSGILVARLRPR